MKSQTAIALAGFERIKRIIEGDEKGRGRLDVLSINADYRRLGPERKRIEREERKIVDDRLHEYMNTLTSVELSQIEDRLLDQVDLDDLLDRLPAGDHPRAVSLWKELENRHSELLARRREALETLVAVEQDTLDAIDRRLAILEEESSFIRTHLFWIRDQDPISATTVGLAAGEIRRLARVSIGLTRQTAAPSSWKRPAPEFLAAVVVVAVLPLGVFRARRALGRRLNEMFPAPPTAAPAPAAVDAASPPAEPKVD